MKFIHKLSYKLGRLSTKTPSLSLDPLRLAYKSFKQGRKDVRDSESTTIVL